MLLKGFAVIDFCEDGKQNISAFSKEKEAENAFVESIKFYTPEISEETLNKAIRNQFYANGNGSYLYLQPLNRTCSSKH